MKNQYPIIFKAFPLPGLLLLVDAPRFTITDVNTAYLKVSNKKEKDLIGNGIFEVLSGNYITHSLAASLETVLNTQHPHKIAAPVDAITTQDSKRCEENIYGFENVPILNDEGKIAFIIHTLKNYEDTTLDSCHEEISQKLTRIDAVVGKTANYTAADITAISCDEIDNSGDLKWSVNREFKLIDANKAFIKDLKASSGILIKPGEELLMRDIFPEDYLAFFEESYKNVLQGESLKKEIYTPAINNGKESWSEISFSPIYNGNPVVGVTCYSRNITERKLAEIENSFKAKLLNTIGQAVIATDLGGIINFWNKAAEEIYGWTMEEVIGKNVIDIVPAHQSTDQANAIIKQLLKGQSWAGEFMVQRKDGEVFPVFVTDSPVYDQDQKLSGIIGVSSDISAKKKAEKQTKDSEQLYRTLFEQNLAGFYQTNIEGVILKCNDAFAKMLKYDSAKELLAKNACELYFSPGERSAFIADIISNTKLYNYEGVLKCKDGSPLYFLENISLRKNAETNEKFFDGILIDITERKLAELLLKESNQRYKYLTKATFDAIWDWDFLTDTVYWSAGFQTLFGYNLLEITPGISSWTEHIHPEDIDRVLKGIYEFIDGTQTNWTDTYRYIKADLTCAHVADKGFVIRDEHGKAIRMVGAMQDITEKKMLEDLLDKASTLARIGSWEIDLVKNSLYWSRITKEIHEVEPGFIPDLQTGINFYKEGNNRDLITQKIQDASEKGISFDVELQILSAKGNDKWVRAIGEAEFANKICIRINGSFQDIDTRKKSEIAVTKAYEEKNTILESIGDAFFAVDKNWKVTYWNNQAEKMLGVPKNEILGLSLWEAFPDRVDSISYKKYHESLETSEVVHFEDYLSSLSKWFSVSSYPSGNGLSVYFKDVTDRKMAEIRLNQLNEDLQKQAKDLAISNTDLEQFAYVASHDLQEPLRMVTGFLTQLEKKYGNTIDKRGKEYIEFAVDGAKRMRQIILDLLNFSRAGRTEDQQEDIDVHELVTEIQILVRKQIEEKKAIILMEALPVVRSYKAPLRQVFQNLVSNALKYTRNGANSEIKITAKDLKTHWQFAVTDNGIGISKEYFERVFIIFQRLHSKNEYAGTGMGLALSKKIIENLGGRIWIESEEGKGSTFYFTLLKQQ